MGMVQRLLKRGYQKLITYRYELLDNVVPAQNVFSLLPLVAKQDPATVGGKFTGLGRGTYGIRPVLTVTYFRSDLAFRYPVNSLLIPGATQPGSSGTINIVQSISVPEDSSAGVEMARNSSAARTIPASTFYVELEKISERCSSGFYKVGTQLLPTINVFTKVTGWSADLNFSLTTQITNDEIIVPDTGTYILVYSCAFTTNNAAQQVRVVNQNGLVLATKTSPSVAGQATVELTKGDSIHLEAYADNTTTGRRTVAVAGTVMRIIAAN